MLYNWNIAVLIMKQTIPKPNLKYDKRLIKIHTLR